MDAPRSSRLMRPLQAAVASGGVSSLVVTLARELLRSELQPPFPTEVCLPPLLEEQWNLDFRSLCLGILIGFAAGPIIDTLFLVRQGLIGGWQRTLRAPQRAWRFLNE